MKTNYTPQNLRTIANEKASGSILNLNKAKEANRKLIYYTDKVNTVRNFLLNSPLLLFTILYLLILIVDAVFMKPIIQVVVEHGFKMESVWSLYLFIIIYILLIFGLTIGVSYGFSKLLDHKLRELQVELETISRQGVSKAIIEDEVLQMETKEHKLGLFFTVVLFALLVTLSLYRNYIVNGFHVTFDSPDDWLNLIIPIALGIALCFFGIYKDAVFKLLRFKAKAKKYEEQRDGFQTQSDKLARQAIEQDNESSKNGESIPQSADLKEVFQRYENKSQHDSTYYNDKMQIELHLSARGIPVPNVQVFALTGDNCSLFGISDEKGFVCLEWSSDCEWIRSIRIGPYELQGTKWLHKDILKIDLEDLLSRQPDNSTTKYLHDRF